MSLRSPLVRRAARLLVPALLVVAAALSAAGCGSSGSGSKSAAPGGTVTEVSAGTIHSAADVALPSPADTTLTLTGFGAANAGSDLRLSIAEIEKMHTVKADVYEPFLKRRVVFQGVELKDLLGLAKLPSSARSIYSVAYNDYAVTLPLSILDHPGAILATRADGKLIPVAKGGPTRVVFTDDHPDTKNESLWIWSTRTLAVR